MNIPRLYAPVNICFSSLRHGIGNDGGVIYDNDTYVARKCRRVLCENYLGGWKWQIVDMKNILMLDWDVMQDKYHCHK